MERPGPDVTFPLLGTREQNGASRAPVRDVAWYRWFAAIGALALGAVGMAGWWLGWPVLTYLLPRWPTMKPATALVCVLLGIALLCSRTEAQPAVRLARAVCAAAAAVLAILALAESRLGVEIGIGRLLVRRVAGLPADRASLAFLFVAAAALSLDYVTRRRRSPAQWLALAGGLIACLALLGYAFDLRPLHSPRQHPVPIGMAFHTAIAAVLLSSGFLVARPNVGFVAAVASEHAGGMVSRRLLLGLLAFFPVALFVLVGRRLGWYDDAVVAASLVLLGLINGAVLILLTSVRLNRYDQQRKEMAARLGVSEQRLRLLVSRAPDAIFVANLDGRYTEVNEAACRLLGLPADQIVGRTILDFIPPADAERLLAERQELLDQGPRVSEWTLRRSDGAQIPIEMSSSVLPDGRWQGFAREITQRKKAESELLQSRESDRQRRDELERVTSAAATISEVVAELPEPDVSTVLHTIALEAQVLTGARYVAIGLGTDPERPFDSWVVLGVRNDVAEQIGRRPRPVGLLGRVARTGQTVRVADVHREPAFRGFPPNHPPMTSLLGVPIRYHDRTVGNLYLADKDGGAPFTEQDERLVKMLAGRAAVAIETTTLYVGEAAQRTWLRNVIDELPDGVIILDGDGRTVLTNRVVLGYTLEDAGARDVWANPRVFDLRTPDGDTVDVSTLPPARALARGEASTSEALLLQTRDGRSVPVVVSAAPVHGGAGQITGATVVIQDITALRERERLREEWISLIAHDLRQPVAAMSLSISSLVSWCDQTAGDKEKRAVGRIQSGLTRVSSMIDDLLDASQVEAKRLSISPTAIDLAPFLDHVADQVRQSSSTPPIRVVSEPGLHAWIDPQRLQQVITNLLTNAVKYGNRIDEITVEARPCGEAVQIDVCNRGPGIPGDQISLLFSRFGRTREVRAARTPGTGLGLYIAKGIVEAHGGRIWVDSEPGELTAFHLLVPGAAPPQHPQVEAPATAG